LNFLETILSAAIVLSSTSCAHTQDRGPCGALPPIPDAPASSIPEQTFSSPEGRFKIALPPTTASPTTSYDGANGRIETTIYKWSVLNHGQYQVSYSDSDRVLENAADKEIVFNNLRDLLLSKGPGQIESDTQLQLAGHPGREIRIKDGNGINIYRAYLVGRRMYTISAFVPGKLECAMEAVVKVLDSFELVDDNLNDKR
jgi:hypothetical protein